MALETPESRFRQVADLLRASIKSGEYPPGSTLPSEPKLAAKFETARATVNRALTILRSEGWIRTEHGRGSIVNELPVIKRNSMSRQTRAVREADGSRGAFDGELRALGLASKSSLRSVGPVPAPADIADALGVSEGDQVLTRDRLMSVNDIPVMLSTSYFPLEVAGGTQLEQEDTGTGGAYSRLADLGHAVTEFTEDIIVRPPSADEARLLRMDPDQRVFEVVRSAVTADGRTVEVNRMVKPAHQWKLSYTWPAE